MKVVLNYLTLIQKETTKNILALSLNTVVLIKTILTAYEIQDTSKIMISIILTNFQTKFSIKEKTLKKYNESTLVKSINSCLQKKVIV